MTWLNLFMEDLAILARHNQALKFNGMQFGLGQSDSEECLQIPCERKLIPQKCEIHPGTASQRKTQTKTTAPRKQGM